MISQLSDWIKQARRIVVLTGAGVSAESGLATFRGSTQQDDSAALWEDVDPMKMASVEGFREDPNRVWQWYQWRRRQVKDAEPNAAHRIIAWLEEHYPVTLITQNVDGLHQRAGSKDVCCLHGQIMQNICVNHECSYSEPVVDVDRELPLCPLCQQNYLRPGVVWFGESLDSAIIARAESATYDCDLFLSVGTSSQVYPAAGFAQFAKSRGAKVVEINIEETGLSTTVDLMVNESAAVAFEQLRQRL